MIVAIVIGFPSLVPRLSPRAHAIIDDLCTRKEKPGYEAIARLRAHIQDMYGRITGPDLSL